jgi:hypothetical protein
MSPASTSEIIIAKITPAFLYNPGLVDSPK